MKKQGYKSEQEGTKMKQLNVTLNSLHALLMNDNKGVNPSHPITKELKEITSKRKKTDEDHDRILELKWKLALYHKEDVGPYVPAANVEACIRDAAKRSKRGKDVVMGIRVEPEYIPLEYDGPRDIDSLYNCLDKRDVRIGKIQRASVTLSRPRFDHWKISFSLDYDEDIFSESEIHDILKWAGKYQGLCDYRPRYGTFEPIITK